jgi:hypothetical protein
VCSSDLAGQLRSDLDVPAAAAGLVALSKGAHLQMVMDTDAIPEGLASETERWLTGKAATRADQAGPGERQAGR